MLIKSSPHIFWNIQIKKESFTQKWCIKKRSCNLNFLKTTYTNFINIHTWCFTLCNSLPGTYVAFSVQSGTAKSWHSMCAKYSQTTSARIIERTHDFKVYFTFLAWQTYLNNVLLDYHLIVCGKRYRISFYDELAQTSNAPRDS